MSLTYRILGTPERDNALLVHIDTGQSIDRLLFDCGDGCISGLGFSEVQAVDHLFLSHLHMDHVGGFDSFFRCNYGRDTKPNQIWGPPQTARILQHRFQGFLWNLHEQMNASWRVSEVHADGIHTTRYELREAFAITHEDGSRPHQGVICDGTAYTVEAFAMEHRTTTLAYLVREKPRRNIDPARMASMGLKPGPWLKQLKDSADGADSVVIGGVTHNLADLRKTLVVESQGDSIAYLTDFLLDSSAMERLSSALRGCRTIVCEGQYRHADLELARKNYHMTTVLSATLAQRAGAGELVLFHLSDRYERDTWVEMLREARQVFPNTRYPPHWNLEPSGV
jgi:ribonuclease Z